eukprot:TRINITY_DN23591_c0_g3_i2.p1 TRINITY_DN23591_c0_g3~~TRINITY_DN23591_c0_g3_i2.p1  ORF type:complete len:364 (+),score=57.14 TRINITY_DN23591_c0_g3_i2:130-1221(+)
MSGYPMFLLYFCNGIYTVAFFAVLAVWKVLARKKDQDPTSSERVPMCGTWPLQRYFILIGITMGLSLEMQQFANGKVIADLQSCLYQLYLPATALISIFWLRKRLTAWQITGALLVFVGVLIAIVPGGITGKSDVVWVVVYALSSLPLGMSSVLQEEAFERFPGAGALQMTAWSSLYAVLFFVLSLPVTMIPGLVFDNSGSGAVYPHGATWAELWQDQGNAMSCFLGHQPLPPHCSDLAWPAVLEYSFAYGINVLASIMLVQEVDAVFVPIVGSFFVPGVAVASAIPAIVELFGLSADDVEPIRWYIVLGASVLTLGLLVYEGGSFRRHLLGRKRFEIEDSDTSDQAIRVKLDSYSKGIPMVI